MPGICVSCLARCHCRLLRPEGRRWRPPHPYPPPSRGRNPGKKLVRSHSMSPETDAVRVLVCRLLAHQTLPRTDELVRRLFVDATYREGVESALRQVGLELAENVYAPYIAVRVTRELETPVFEDGRGGYWSNNVGLSGGAMALLTILWSLLILPKRQRQQEGQEDPGGDGNPPPGRAADPDIAVER